MKIERLIGEGLSLEGSARAKMKDLAASGPEKLQSHGHALGTSVEPSTDDEAQRRPLRKGDRRLNVIEEIRRQSGVFFDDSEIDGEETGGSADEIAIAGNGHDKEQ